tara:strand:+ start:3870 stop:8507 length:4638 start_codon:yes stop_codon:yes gene_type:complete
MALPLSERLLGLPGTTKEKEPLPKDEEKDPTQSSIVPPWTVRAALEGLGQGATWDVAQADFEPGEPTYDVPLIGEISPYREVFKVIGGIPTGGTMWRMGSRISRPLVKASNQLLRKWAPPMTMAHSRELAGQLARGEISQALFDETIKKSVRGIKPAKLIRRGLNHFGRSVPTGVAAGGFDWLFNDGDYDDHLGKSLEYLALGIVGDVGVRFASKRFKQIKKIHKGISDLVIKRQKERIAAIRQGLEPPPPEEGDLRLFNIYKEEIVEAMAAKDGQFSLGNAPWGVSIPFKVSPHSGYHPGDVYPGIDINIIGRQTEPPRKADVERPPILKGQMPTESGGIHLTEDLVTPSGKVIREEGDLITPHDTIDDAPPMEHGSIIRKNEFLNQEEFDRARAITKEIKFAERLDDYLKTPEEANSLIREAMTEAKGHDTRQGLASFWKNMGNKLFSLQKQYGFDQEDRIDNLGTILMGSSVDLMEWANGAAEYMRKNKSREHIRKVFEEADNVVDDVPLEDKLLRVVYDFRMKNTPHETWPQLPDHWLEPKDKSRKITDGGDPEDTFVIIDEGEAPGPTNQDRIEEALSTRDKERQDIASVIKHQGSNVELGRLNLEGRAGAEDPTQSGGSSLLENIIDIRSKRLWLADKLGLDITPFDKKIMDASDKVKQKALADEKNALAAEKSQEVELLRAKFDSMAHDKETPLSDKNRTSTEGAEALAAGKTVVKQDEAPKTPKEKEMHGDDKASISEASPPHPAGAVPDPQGKGKKYAKIHYGLVGPGSRYGLGRNPWIQQGVEKEIDLKYESRGLMNKWMDKYAEFKEYVKSIPVSQAERDEVISEAGGVRKTLSSVAKVIPKMKSPIDEQILRERLFKIAKLMDDETDKRKAWAPLKGRPVLQDLMSRTGRLPERPMSEGGGTASQLRALNMYQSLMNDIADALGMSRGQRMSVYFRHMFSGDTGKVRAANLIRGMGDANLGVDLMDYLGDSKKQLGSLFRRYSTSEKSGQIEYDLDLITGMYIRGAADKIYIDRSTRMANEIHSFLPDISTNEGRILHSQWAKYMDHSHGKPTKARVGFTDMLSELPSHRSNLFMRGASNLVEIVGGAEDRGILSRLNMSAEEYAKIDPEVKETMLLGAQNWLIQLNENKRAFDRVSGKRINRNFPETKKKYRAMAALKINDMWQALINPELQQPVMRGIYSTQIVAKLGLNLLHAITNMTQTPTNVAALLKKGYTTKGMIDFFNKDMNVRDFSGTHRTAGELLRESGVSDTILRHEEFSRRENFTGVISKLVDYAMLPAKWTEDWNRGVAFLGAYRQFTDEGSGHLQAMKKARALSSEANFEYSSAGTIPMLKVPGVRLLFMFSSYPMHQMNFTAELASDAVKGIKGKLNPAQKTLTAEDLEQAISFVRSDGKNGDVMPFFKHLFAYAALYGAATQLAPDTNLSDRTMHPLAEAIKSPTKFGKGDDFHEVILNVFTGPIADTLTSLTYGNVQSALEHFFLMTTPLKMWKKGKWPWDYSSHDVLDVISGHKYKEPESAARRKERLKSQALPEK